MFPPIGDSANPEARPYPHPAGLREALLVWALLTGLTGSLQLHAALTPPSGRAFVGYFLFQRDAYDYLSYVQQAEDGAVVFRNKAVGFDHSPAFLNLEFLVSGWLSAALGGRPVLAHLLVGHAAALAFLLAAGQWLRAIGLPAAARIPSLLLVAFGGGLGGLRFALGGLPGLDMAAGLFPFVEALTNPHHAVATALLAWALLLLARETPRAVAGGVGLGTALGLVRPFDLLVLGAARGLAVLLTGAPRTWVRGLLPLVGLVPVLAYDVWLFGFHPGFRAFTVSTVYRMPPLSELAWGLGPPVTLAAVALATPAAGHAARHGMRHLAAWAAVVALVLIARPTSVALQFAAGVGLPLLLLSALVVARLRRLLQLAALLVLVSTPLVLSRVALSPNPLWHVPAERVGIAWALRSLCRTDDVVLAPRDVGLYVIGLTRCRAYVSYEVSPDFEARDAAVTAFYSSMGPEERADFLSIAKVRFVVLPAGAGPRAEALVASRTPLARRWVVEADGRALAVYERSARSTTPPAPSPPPLARKPRRSAGSAGP